MPSTIYDVTTWTTLADAQNDIGAVINSIIADIKANQLATVEKPGAVIYIPPGDYSLKTRIVIDISYLQIKGSGHGFTSSSIRYNEPSTTGWFELWPGGSRIKVENTDGNPEAILIARTGKPRLSSIELVDFCLDGLSFGSDENSYSSTKVGVRSTTDTDSVRIVGMGMVYLGVGVEIYNADALQLNGNFIAECSSCVKLVGSGQATMVNDNHFGAGPEGFSLFAEGHWGLIVSGNNFFPRGKSSVHLKNCTNNTISSNRFHSYASGIVTMEGQCHNNLISSNHFFRTNEKYDPFEHRATPPGFPAPTDDLFGVIHVRGKGNTIVSNHISYDVPEDMIRPANAKPTLVLVKTGENNYVAMNHHAANVDVNAVLLDGATIDTKVIYCGIASEFAKTGTPTYSHVPIPPNAP